MTTEIQVIIIVLAGLGILYIGNLVRVRRLELKYALIWFLVGVLVILFAANKHWLQALSSFLGINDNLYANYSDFKSYAKSQEANTGSWYSQ